MRRLAKKWLLIAGLILVIIFIFQRINWLPSFREIFGAKPLVIDNTPVLIKEINELSQLVTVTAYDEVVVDSVKFDANDLTVRTITGITMNPLKPAFERLVLIVKGIIVAGTDLKQLKNDDIFIKEDSVSVRLPRAVILDAIVNPSGFETFIETGEWNNDAVGKVKIKARDKMINRALSNKILEKAEAKAKFLMENFLKSSGFRKVDVGVRD
jgi:Protein of unknown function (DUF4230)